MWPIHGGVQTPLPPTPTAVEGGQPDGAIGQLPALEVSATLVPWGRRQVDQFMTKSSLSPNVFPASAKTRGFLQSGNVLVPAVQQVTKIEWLTSLEEYRAAWQRLPEISHWVLRTI